MTQETGFFENHVALAEFISSLAAMLAAIATFVTVREMKKSRKDSFNPDIFIQDKTIIIVPSDYDDIIFSNDKFFFELFNLGMGAAKHIQIEWHNNFRERIKPYKDILFDPKNDFLKLKFGQYSFDLPLEFEAEKTKISFAKGNDKGNTRFMIGENYIRFLMMEAYYKMYQTDQHLFVYIIQELNNSYLKIKYLNAQNRRKTVNHRIRTGVTIFRNEETLELDSINVSFPF